MIVKTKKDITLTDIEVLIRYAQESGELKKLLALLRSAERRVHCTEDDRERIVSASDIYYIESVDKKTFVYLREEVLRSRLRLYQLQEELKQAGFVQISKSCLLNMNVLESIHPLMNSRMEALLSNGERVFVTRKYLADIRHALQDDGDNKAVQRRRKI